MSTPRHLARTSIKTQLAEYDAYLAERFSASGLPTPPTPGNGKHRADVKDADA